MSRKRKPADFSAICRDVSGIFDTHCHYDDPAFDDDRNEILERMFSDDSAVKYLVHAGCDIGSSKEGIALAEQYPNYYCTVGIHPTYIRRAELPDDYIGQLRELAKHPKVRAIGEIGLDYAKDPDRDEQKRVFIEQLELARELDLPVVIHCRNAYGDLPEILRKHPVRGECHCFSGSAEVAKELVKMGFYIAFGGALTWENAEKPRKALAAVPLDRLLFETDAPYLAPAPFNYSRCQSEMIVYVAKTASEVLGVSAQELTDITRENAKRLFGIGD
ncbi:TatD DNase family protein [Ruminococcus sp. YE71]|uniref:TatD family hydrolase n=1 Tax=unclassified Ruminococcus TaxID=2608920 RepID=UPI00088F3E40|nr:MULTISPECIES: TatD family hydrolase [unclassified Ruminococcus]SDA11131.1 TatD DNase family protein [Ruminococcus sp. YE78]SFW14803.1 TatD DNase family protein [Ruminococcus sp. YE71]